MCLGGSLILQPRRCRASSILFFQSCSAEEHRNCKEEFIEEAKTWFLKPLVVRKSSEKRTADRNIRPRQHTSQFRDQLFLFAQLTQDLLFSANCISQSKPIPGSPARPSNPASNRKREKIKVLAPSNEFEPFRSTYTSSTVIYDAAVMLCESW